MFWIFITAIISAGVLGFEIGWNAGKYHGEYTAFSKNNGNVAKVPWEKT